MPIEPIHNARQAERPNAITKGSNYGTEEHSASSRAVHAKLIGHAANSEADKKGNDEDEYRRDEQNRRTMAQQSGHSAASWNWMPCTSSSEQRCIVGLARHMELVRKKSPIG